MDIERIVEGVLNRDIRGIAKAISFVENNPDRASLIIDRLFDKTGRAKIIGITGPPGAGKSTLTDKIARKINAYGHTVGIIAVDPSSPFSGGAVLGDRIRMNTLSSINGIYIRSMATRGMLGGLSRACLDAVDILDAAGFGYILVETVGVGQDEVDIFKVSDLNMLVLVPGLGDDVQALKAGIMEIADIFVVNKSDREGVDRLLTILSHFNTISEKDIPVFKTVATSGNGVDKVVEYILKNVSNKDTDAISTRRIERIKYRVIRIVQDKVVSAVLKSSNDNLNNLLTEVIKKEMTPYQMADRLMESLCR